MMWCTDLSEESAASIFKVSFNPVSGGVTILGNVDTYLQDYRAWHPEGHLSSWSPP